MNFSNSSAILSVRTLAFLGVGLLISLQFHCKGPDGSVGPKGPAGVGGPPGAANVQYSGWFSPSSWVPTPSLVFAFHFDTTAPGITQEILDSGIVLAYIKMANDSGIIRPLPATPTSQAIVFWNFVLPAVGKIRFTFSTNDGSFAPSTSDKFRYVIIPGGVKLGKQIRTESFSYEALKEHYYIPD